MRIKNLIAGVAVLFCSAQGIFGDTLTFVAQPISGGGFDYDWFSAINWFTTNSSGALIPAGRVPQANDNAVITGQVDAGASGIRIQDLLATNGATISGGTFSIENLQMLSSSSFSNSTVNILVTMIASGTNCTLNAATLNILGIASGTLLAIAPAGSPTFVLTQGSTLQIAGQLTLSDGVELSGSGLPQNKIALGSAALLDVVNSASVSGGSTGHLFFDNSGTIRADSGTVWFQDGIDWQCSGGLGEFDAVSPSASFVFNSPFQLPIGATNLFLGPGTSYFSAGGTFDGTAQVGGVELGSQIFVPGKAEIGDAVTGSGTIEVIDGGSFPGSVLTWSNGALGLPSVNIDTNSELLVTSDMGTSRQLVHCVLNNSGLCRLLSDRLGFDQGAAISNLSGGVFRIEADGVFSGSSFPAGGIFDNTGTFIKSSGGITQFGATGSGQAPDFNNWGLVEINSGQLNLAEGSSSGTFQTASNAVLRFWGGGRTVNPGASFEGTGSVQLLQGLSPPTLRLTSPITIPELEVSTNATLLAPGTATTNAIQIGTLIISAHGLITNGNFNVQNLQMLDSSTFAGSVVTVSNTLLFGGTNGESATGLQLSASVLNNSGLCRWLTEGPVLAGAGAIFNNLAGASLSIETDTSLSLGGSGPQLVIINNGTFVKNGGSGATTMMADFDNSGTIEIKTGSLSFTGALQQSQGSTRVDAGATLGAITFNVQGGSLSGAGTIAAPVINSASVTPGASPGILTLAPGEDYQQSASGTLVIELGGASAGAQFDQLDVGGNASLNGALHVSLIKGFIPQPGEQFQILRCASQTGIFSSLDAGQPAGTQWLIRYEGTNVTLVVAGEVTLAEPMLSGGVLHLAFNTTPGLSYVVQAADTLNPPAWQTLTTIAGDGTIKTATDSAAHLQRFYRVMLQ